MHALESVGGVGIGLRSEFAQQLANLEKNPVDFLEIAPENWMQMGGWRAKLLKELSRQYPIIAHGLSLSIGGPSPLNIEFIKQLKAFFIENNVVYYSEHLSYCTDSSGYLYDLMPIPFTEEAVQFVAGRIKQVQDILEQRIAMENVSYYCAPGQELSEIEFINAVLEEADCDLLLDVNNIYVNSVNHRYDACDFLSKLPQSRIAYVHIAGHLQETEELLIDTHGEAVIEPVWQLLQKLYLSKGIFPTLLERDNNIPPLTELLSEASQIEQCQQQVKEGEASEKQVG